MLFRGDVRLLLTADIAVEVRLSFMYYLLVQIVALTMSGDAIYPKPKPGLLKRHEDYTVGIICALHKEARAVRAAFDFTVPYSEVLSPVRGDKNPYSCGTMGN